MKSALITFEGIEGSGKSTQIALLAGYLKGKGYPVVQTREPGGTKLGEAIRSLILHGADHAVSAKAEFFLYLADRAQHMQEVILPELRNNRIVLCDRFTDSTLIYQGYVREIGFPDLKMALSFAADAVVPDITFVLDMDVKKGLARLKGRKEKNRLDQESMAFHQKIRDGYLALVQQGQKRFHLIHADQNEADVFSQIQKVVDDNL